MPIKENLIARISAAFADIPYPGDDAYYGESRTEDFKGKHWTQLSREVLVYHQDDLPWFTAKGYQFYLPAFLLAGIDTYKSDDIRYFVIWSLCPLVTLNKSEQDIFLNRVHLFSRDQSCAIKDFLEYVQEDEDCAGIKDEEAEAHSAKFALKQYWHHAAAGEEVTAAELVPPGEGIWWLRMPDVIGKPLSEAVTTLKQHGLADVRVADRSYGDAPEVVVRSLPEAGELARLCAQATLYVRINQDHVVDHMADIKEPSAAAKDPSKPPPDYF